MSSKVQFPELNEILVEAGLSINAISKDTKVARNTLSAMRDDKEVSTNSVTKLLAGLKEKRGIDVRRYSVILQDRIAMARLRSTVVNGSPSLVVLDSQASRTPALIAADLAESIRSSASFARELSDAMRKPDTSVLEEDARDIKRFHRHLDADLAEIYIELEKIDENGSNVKA